MEVVEEDSGVVGLDWVHEVDCWSGIVALAFASESDLSSVVGCSVRVDDWWVGVDKHDIYLCTVIAAVDDLRHLSERDFLDDVRLRQPSPGSLGASILYEEHLVRRWVPMQV